MKINVLWKVAQTKNIRSVYRKLYTCFAFNMKYIVATDVILFIFSLGKLWFCLSFFTLSSYPLLLSSYAICNMSTDLDNIKKQKQAVEISKSSSPLVYLTFHHTMRIENRSHNENEWKKSRLFLPPTNSRMIIFNFF